MAQFESVLKKKKVYTFFKHAYVHNKNWAITFRMAPEAIIRFLTKFPLK